MRENVGLGAGLAECADFGAVDQEGLVGEAGEEVVVVDGAGETGCYFLCSGVIYR